MSNPFGNELTTTTPRENTLLAEVSVQREVAEVQGAIILAKKFKRNQIEAMDRILTACQRPTLAEVSLYSYARGGTDITGPSIRMAEAIAQAWGNIQFGIRELEQRNGESTVESYAWDLETNTRQSKVFQVKHVRYTKKGGSYDLTDPRDQYEVVANQGARRLRACILGIIPGDVIEAAVNECENTLKAKADTSPAAMAKMVGAFQEYGVSKDQIEKRIQRRIDAITPAQVISLRKVYNSLKDGMSVSIDWFEPAATPEGEPEKMSATEAAKKALKGKRKNEPPAENLSEKPIEKPTIPEPEASPGECPSHPGDHPYLTTCAEECPDFEGCTAWPAKE